MNDELQAIAALEQRIASLEQVGNGQKPPEDARERMQRERQERIDKKEVDTFSRKADERSASRPTGSHRREDLARRSQTNLPGPQMTAKQAPAPQAAKMGDAIEIVVVDNGEFKTGMFYIDGALEAVV